MVGDYGGIDFYGLNFVLDDSDAFIYISLIDGGYTKLVYLSSLKVGDLWVSIGFCCDTACDTALPSVGEASYGGDLCL